MEGDAAGDGHVGGGEDDAFDGAGFLCGFEDTEGSLDGGADKLVLVFGLVCGKGGGDVEDVGCVCGGGGPVSVGEEVGGHKG